MNQRGCYSCSTSGNLVLLLLNSASNTMKLVINEDWLTSNLKKLLNLKHKTILTRKFEIKHKTKDRQDHGH